MTHYSPTLFVGLGGSGVAVVGWLKEIAGRDGASEPLAFRGIDFDLSNGGSGSPPLRSGEFRIFPPSAIAECVRTINNNVVLPFTDPARKAHDLIRQWYPDVEGEVIRYAQAEAAGARQWRVLGRIGFFLNDKAILDEVEGGLTEIANKGSKAERVVLISSMSGGTGSGILIDVAASIRVKHPDIPVHAVLLLPEFFDHVDFRSKIVANGFAMLWELAELTNRLEFKATYPRLPEINWRTTSAPLTRIYLLGPYVGDRRPFFMPDEAYSTIAELLLVLSDAELRGNARTHQANSDGAAVGRDDPYSRYVFSSVAAASIRLIRYADLGCLVSRALAIEAASREQPNPVFNLLTGLPTTHEKEKIVHLVEEAARKPVAESGCSAEDIKKTVKALFEKFEKRKPARWNRKELKTFMESVKTFANEFPDKTLVQQLVNGAGKIDVSRGPLATACAELEKELSERLRRLKDQLHSHPHALADVLEYLRQRIQRDADVRQPAKIEHLEDFDEWLEASALSNALLGVPLLRRVRLRKLQDHVAEALTKRFDENGQQLLEKMIYAYAEERLRSERDKAQEQWQNLAQLQEDVVKEVDHGIQVDDRRLHQRASLGFADVDVARVLTAELKRLDNDEARTKVKDAVLKAFQSAANAYKESRGNPAELLDGMNEAMYALRTGSGGTMFDCLSPDMAYGPDAVDRTLLTCVTPVFRPGRIDGLISQQTARLVIPKGFRGHAAFEQRIKDSCRGLLGAGVQQVSSQDGDRMFVLVESLFHPADDIAHVDSYRNDYQRRSRPELFHIDKSLPDRMVPLLASARTGKVSCGNVGCTGDIRSVSRDEWICPFCGKPIRNRCGNLRCGLDDLSERPDLDDIIRRDTCPECHERLSTYWWECPRHQQRIPMDKPHCPHCVREERTPEKRPQSLDRFVCPACKQRGVAEPYVATGNVARACRLGVNGHEEDRALRELESALPQGERCPKCGTHLVPYCPLPGDAKRHFLHRHNPWKCMTHPDVTFFTCFKCKFAVIAEDAFCRRCGAKLADCRYCTSQQQVRIPAVPAGERCPNCGIPRVSSSLQPDPLDRFCTNIFGCPAAAALSSASLPRGTETCPFCASHALFPQYVRDQTINDCPLCRLVFTPSRFPEKDATPPSGLCPLCGLRFADATQLKSDRGNLAATVAIVRALVFMHEEDETLRTIYRALLPERRRAIPLLLREFFERIQAPEIRKLVSARIDRLILACGEFMMPESGETPATAVPPDVRRERESLPPGKTIEDLTHPDHVLELKSDQIDEWVQQLRNLRANADQLESFLGAGMAYVDPEDAQRYDEIRRMVRDRFREE